MDEGKTIKHNFITPTTDVDHCLNLLNSHILLYGISLFNCNNKQFSKSMHYGISSVNMYSNWLYWVEIQRHG